ncbi:glucosaminidase domain-containing protein [Shewanella atlantica]|uniref:Glucosaminidase n=1 Tax=Shewanella atlantica TaxID=271099 RepID=A0A3S0IXW5_9GAMM|nr:glucosaminidase domain-containing protein [Shewanella atlantica]RTR33793.1 glucosaminidase [Shewanella atlantica]
MKTGRVGKLTVAVSLVFISVIVLKVVFVDIDDDKEQQVGSLVENKQALSLIPDFSAISNIAEKKQAFFDYLRPSIRLQNGIIKDERNFLQRSKQHLEDGLLLTDAELYRIEKIANKYQYSSRSINTSTLDKLLVRTDTIPESMVLIQAANETGWGSSRFAKEGLNFFGQWCFRKGCGLVPQSRTAGMSHEVAVFDSVEASVASYMRNLNSNAAYSLLRSIRADLRAQNKQPQASELVWGLVNYSERQEAYIDELLEMLRQNKQYLVENHEERPSV